MSKINKFFNLSKLEYFNIGIVITLIFSRLIPHPPNFTPIISVAILSGFLFKNIYISFVVLLFSLLISDLFIGFYTNMIFVYISILVIALTYFKNINKINYKKLFLISLTGSLIFFIISNFGVWLLGSMYQKNIHGLVKCYFLAIPFFKNTLLSTIFYSYLTFFSVDFLKKKLNLQTS